MRGGSASLHPRREDQDVALELMFDGISDSSLYFREDCQVVRFDIQRNEGESGMRRLKCEHLFLFNAPSREYLDAVLELLR